MLRLYVVNRNIAAYVTNDQELHMASLKSKVLNLYKNLLYMGRDYPLGYEFFRCRCKQAFLKNSKETNPEKIKQMIGHGRYIMKELETLYKLKKYRTLKQRYSERHNIELEKKL